MSNTAPTLYSNVQALMQASEALHPEIKLALLATAYEQGKLKPNLDPESLKQTVQFNQFDLKDEYLSTESVNGKREVVLSRQGMDAVKKMLSGFQINTSGFDYSTLLKQGGPVEQLDNSITQQLLAAKQQNPSLNVKKEQFYNLFNVSKETKANLGMSPSSGVTGRVADVENALPSLRKIQANEINRAYSLSTFHRGRGQLMQAGAVEVANAAFTALGKSKQALSAAANFFSHMGSAMKPADFNVQQEEAKNHLLHLYSHMTDKEQAEQLKNVLEDVDKSFDTKLAFGQISPQDYFKQKGAFYNEAIKAVNPDMLLSEKDFPLEEKPLFDLPEGFVPTKNVLLEPPGGAEDFNDTAYMANSLRVKAAEIRQKMLDKLGNEEALTDEELDLLKKAQDMDRISDELAEKLNAIPLEDRLDPERSRVNIDSQKVTFAALLYSLFQWMRNLIYKAIGKKVEKPLLENLDFMAMPQHAEAVQKHMGNSDSYEFLTSGKNAPRAEVLAQTAARARESVKAAAQTLGSVFHKKPAGNKTKM